MTKKRWEQIAAAGGIVFVVLQLTAIGILLSRRLAASCHHYRSSPSYSSLALSGHPSAGMKKALLGFLILLLDLDW